MRKLVYLLLCCAFMASCGSGKSTKRTPNNFKRNISKSAYQNTSEPKRRSSKPEAANAKKIARYEEENKSETADLATKITDYAKTYLGTSYRYGGMSSSGMDCSGLIYLSFSNAADIFLPRSSREIAKQGNRIRRNQISKGDLLFFKTDPKRNVINHIGLVVEINGSHIHFIHSSTSRGVMISELDDIYWHKVFVEARRVL